MSYEGGVAPWVPRDSAGEVDWEAWSGVAAMTYEEKVSVATWGFPEELRASVRQLGGFLLESRPRSARELAERLGWAASDVAAALSALEYHGAVRWVIGPGPDGGLCTLWTAKSA
jgi:hypothetical protein